MGATARVVTASSNPGKTELIWAKEGLLISFLRVHYSIGGSAELFFLEANSSRKYDGFTVKGISISVSSSNLAANSIILNTTRGNIQVLLIRCQK